MRKLFASLGAIALLIVAPTVFAQGVPCTALIPATISIASELPSTFASADVGVHASLHNESASLLSGLSLFTYVTERGTGIIVAQSPASGTVALLPHADGQLDFDWQTPAQIPTGEYLINAQLVAANSTYADIYLRPEQATHAALSVQLDGGEPEASIASVEVNGAPYKPNSGVAGITKSGALVSASISNSTKAPYVGVFTWRLYPPGAKPGDAPIDTSETKVELHPGTTMTVPYTLSDTSYPGYFLQGELASGKSSEFVNVWLSRASAFRVATCTKMDPFPLDGRILLAIIAVIIVALALGAHRFFRVTLPL